ncbi:MAG TPA: SGNH/GDSL hydrolase family protein [bacterium]|nr:SGNH/GDSL hydrolase family protein [bacterium]
MRTNITIFGDSVAYGIFVKNSWAHLLKSNLEKDKYSRVYSLGIDRNTSSDILKRLEFEAVARQAHHIILSIGINDSSFYHSTKKSIVSLKDFTKNIDEIIRLSLEKFDSISIIGPALGDDSNLQPLPMSTTGKSYTRIEAIRYNKVLEKKAKEYSVPYIDLIKELGQEDFFDGLHPNEAGHAKIYNLIRPVVDKLIFKKQKKSS